MEPAQEIQPKQQLPEIWAEKMACPYCASRPLGVFHPTGQADRFVCQSCETSFQLEENGTRVRFVTLPKSVTPALRGQWVALEDALAAFASHQNNSLISGAGETAPTPAEPTPIAESTPPAVVQAKQTPSANLDQSSSNEPKTPPPAQETKPEAKPAPPKDSSAVPSFMANIVPPLFEDGKTGKKPVTSPFYEEDISEPELSAEPQLPEVIKPVDNSWKEREDQRVKNTLPPTPPIVPAFPRSGEDSKPVYVHSDDEPPGDFVPPSFNSEPPKVEMPHPPAGEWVKEEELDLDNPPPARPLEDTPPSVPVQRWTESSSALPEEDMGELRDQMTGAGMGPSLAERKEAAAERAIELQRLGNTETEVRAVLQRSSGLTPDQVAEVMASLDRPEERKRGGRLILIFSIVALIIFSIIAYLFLTNWNAPPPAEQTPGGAATESISGLGRELVSVDSLPAPLQTLAPNGVRIFNDPISVEVVDSSAIPPTTCPASKTSAAALFGGQAADWTQDQQNKGWILLTQQQMVVIKVPTGMTAGYMVFERGPEMRSVTGPAIVRNVYMITVACE